MLRPSNTHSEKSAISLLCWSCLLPKFFTLSLMSSEEVRVEKTSASNLADSPKLAFASSISERREAGVKVLCVGGQYFWYSVASCVKSKSVSMIRNV